MLAYVRRTVLSVANMLCADHKENNSVISVCKSNHTIIGQFGTVKQYGVVGESGWHRKSERHTQTERERGKGSVRLIEVLTVLQVRGVLWL